MDYSQATEAMQFLERNAILGWDTWLALRGERASCEQPSSVS
jgi:hypothetical protein